INLLINNKTTVTIAINTSIVVDEASADDTIRRRRIRVCRILVLVWKLDCPIRTVGIRPPPSCFDIIKHLQQLSFGMLRRLLNLNFQASIMATANPGHKRDTVRITCREKIVFYKYHKTLSAGGGLENPTLRSRNFAHRKTQHGSSNITIS
ncbi:hypothetical protein PHAVU_009G255400, partial [Phaseolus vulgaris]